MVQWCLEVHQIFSKTSLWIGFWIIMVHLSLFFAEQIIIPKQLGYTSPICTSPNQIHKNHSKKPRIRGFPPFCFIKKTRIFSHKKKSAKNDRPFRNEATRNRIALAYWKANRSSAEPLCWDKPRRISVVLLGRNVSNMTTKHNKNWLNLINCIIWLWQDSLAWDILTVMGISSFKGLRNHPWLTFLWMLNFAHELHEPGIERL